MPQIDRCINAWIEANISSTVHEDDKVKMVQKADDLKTHALTQGFTLEELRDACEGDILVFLMNHQNKTN